MVHQWVGRMRRCLRPSRESRSASATSDTTVIATPMTRAANFRLVGVVTNRVSMVALNSNPSGEVPWGSSVKTPTICGRRLGSRTSKDNWPSVPPFSMRPAVPSPSASTMMRQFGSAWATARSAVSNTTSRPVTVMLSDVARMNRPLDVASCPPAGIVESSTPPSAGRSAAVEQGTETRMSVGTNDTSGAATLTTWLSCGQLSCAVV